MFGDSLVFEASDILEGDKERERSENVNNSSAIDVFVKLNMQGVFNCVSLKIFFFLVKINCGLYFLDCFDVLMSKIIFKK